MNKKNQKGFTLVELIVVIAIVAILAAVGIVGYTQFIQNARNTKAQSELDQVVNVIYADALVEGIKISDVRDLKEAEGETPAETDRTLVTAAAGKLTFADDFDEGDLLDLMNVYAEDLSGKFTLVKDELQYHTNGGDGKVTVITGNISGDGFSAEPADEVFKNPRA